MPGLSGGEEDSDVGWVLDEYTLGDLLCWNLCIVDSGEDLLKRGLIGKDNREMSESGGVFGGWWRAGCVPGIGANMVVVASGSKEGNVHLGAIDHEVKAEDLVVEMLGFFDV